MSLEGVVGMDILGLLAPGCWLLANPGLSIDQAFICANQRQMLLPFLRIPALSASSLRVKLLRLPYKRSIAFSGPSVSEDWPDISHLGDHVESRSGDYQFVLSRLAWAKIFRGVAEVTLAVELADVPGGFRPDAIQRADEVSVGERRARVVPAPTGIPKVRPRWRRIEDDFGAIQARARAPSGKCRS